MSQLYLLNKPFRVLSQFTPIDDKDCLASYIDTPNVYPAGRLDYDSEGLLLLTGDGQLQARIADPKFKLKKHYWVQVEGSITKEAISQLSQGVRLKDGPTQPAAVKQIPAPEVWDRCPPIRSRKDQATSWIEIAISEGRNRQVRRMTAHVGFPTLRLIRYKIGTWTLDGLKPGEFKQIDVHLPQPSTKKTAARPSRPSPSRKSKRKP